MNTVGTEEPGTEAALLAAPEEAKLGGLAGEAEPAIGDRRGQALWGTGVEGREYGGMQHFHDQENEHVYTSEGNICLVLLCKVKQYN